MASTSSSRFVMLLLPCIVASSAISPSVGCSRRALVLGGPALGTILSGRQPAVAADTAAELRTRLETPLVSQLSMAPSGGAEPLLPGWLAGRWQCEQTLQRYSTPQGVQYIGAAGRPIAEAEASAAQTRAQIGKPVKLELRWRSVDGGAVEDRPFNAQSRLDAFAGREVVRAAGTCAQAGVDSPGLACTFVDFNGPIVQKQFVNSVRLSAAEPDAFISSDVMRTILARRKVAGDTRNFPPLTADSEVIMSLSYAAPGSAAGRLRLVEFLNANDPLYFSAGGKSVSISDYSLQLTRLPDK